jgi:hypothetical protein
MGSTRRRWRDLHCALRSSERDVAQRILQRAPQGAGTGKDNRRAKIWSREPYRNGERASVANPEGQRTTRTEQACTANGGRQSVTQQNLD